eukprot:CAMPEP_0174588518 /NCGR_PEP_ID=MMETSP0929-20130131/34613_1 /TAXON_ID=548131 ORGANISM="Ostreococcus mediterraneus, Strain clade-D-RCC2572" /NCGR_SAMPLE_ID=MMETSP0929 /ASSEMBLY_ACC=CAM_ASM_000573 /LENGTH=1218 /DNA_ID=CAMNT_0015770637 /DNA_START=380 /DNA_END=4036 /DNA_ORIENTATION=+
MGASADEEVAHRTRYGATTRAASGDDGDGTLTRGSWFTTTAPAGARVQRVLWVLALAVSAIVAVWATLARESGVARPGHERALAFAAIGQAPRAMDRTSSAMLGGCGLSYKCWRNQANDAWKEVSTWQNKYNALSKAYNDLEKKYDNAVNTLQALSTATDISTIEKLNVLPNAIENIIDSAQSTLSNIATGLERKLESLVASIWGGLLDLDANELVNMVENSFQDLFEGAFSASGSASLGQAEKERAASKSKLLSDLREELRRAFRGEELVGASTKSQHSHLGSSLGACHTLEFSVIPDYESPTYLMPWPSKYADDSTAPNSLVIKFPSLYVKLCQKLDKFNVPVKVAQDLIQAFGDMFEAMFAALYEESGIPSIINNVKDLGETFGFNTGRRLLSISDEQKYDILKKHAELRQQLEKSEAVFFRELTALHDVFHHPDGFSEAFMSRLGEASKEARVASAAESSHLGSANTFEGIFREFKEKLKEALDSMGDMELKTTTTMTFGIKMGLDVSHTLFREGEIVTEFFTDENSKSAVLLFPVIPGILVAMDFEAELALPYFFRAEVAGHFDFDVSVSIPLTVTLSKNPSVVFNAAEITVKDTTTGYVVSGLQIGVVSQLTKAFIGLCTGPVCAGVEATARQDVYIGIDVFAQKQSSENTCFVGPNTLRAMWTDWDYSEATRNACQASLVGMGGYLQIPKTEITAGVYLKPLPTTVPLPTDAPDGAIPVEPTLLIEDLTQHIERVYSSDGDWHVAELFHACSSAKSSLAHSAVCDTSCQFTPSPSVPEPTDISKLLASVQSNFVQGDAALKVPMGSTQTIQKSFHLTSHWSDVGITGEDLASGTYVVLLQSVNLYSNGAGMYGESFSGLMSWTAGSTNSHGDASVIALHYAGHAANNIIIHLRTLETNNAGGSKLKLQAKLAYSTSSQTISTTASQEYTFKFRQVLPAAIFPPALIQQVAPVNKIDDLSIFSKSISIVNNVWVNVGIESTSLVTGSYFVSVGVNTGPTGGRLWLETFSGVMSVLSGVTNDEGNEEIALHCAGHARNDVWIKLRLNSFLGNVPAQLQMMTSDFRSEVRQLYSFQFRQVFPSPVIADASNGVYKFESNVQLSTSWVDLGINDIDLPTGAYVIQIGPASTHNVGGGMYSELASGVMSWYSSVTNSHEATEIVLHQAGHAANGDHFYLRVIRSGHADGHHLRLQARTAKGTNAARAYVIACRRVI